MRCVASAEYLPLWRNAEFIWLGYAECCALWENNREIVNSRRDGYERIPSRASPSPAATVVWRRQHPNTSQKMHITNIVA
jgi:hypothetical protein